MSYDDIFELKNQEFKLKQMLVFFLLISTMLLATDRKKCFDDYRAGLLTKEEMMKCSSIIEDTDYPPVIDNVVERRANDQHKNYGSVQTQSTKSELKQQFRCDGRTHCSQMKSYLEAKFFLDNCPNTKMDGDGDGIPCEQQFGMH